MMRFMKRSMVSIALLALLSWAQNPVILLAQAATSAAGDKDLTPARRVMQRLRDSDAKDVLVIAHRSGWHDFPENSVPAITNAIRMGVDIVEIDVRKTSDGHLVLMHDKTVNRTTTGQGCVSDMTLAEIRNLRLKDRAGQVTPFTVPTLEEAMLAAKGSVAVCLDKCDGIFQEVHAILQKTVTQDQAILNSTVPAMELRTRIGPILDEVVAMPNVLMDRVSASDFLPKPSDAHKPVVIHWVFGSTNSPILKDLRALRLNGVRASVNSMWPEHCAGHEDAKALKDPDANYGWLIELGFNVIQTDEPEFLLRYLESRGLRTP